MEDDHLKATHERWAAKLNREDWHYEQCGRCVFWIPLTRPIGLDWGACTNPQSPFDKQVMFEHDGCDEFKDAGEWRELS